MHNYFCYPIPPPPSGSCTAPGACKDWRLKITIIIIITTRRSSLSLRQRQEDDDHTLSREQEVDLVRLGTGHDRLSDHVQL